VDGPTTILCDNQSVVHNGQRPESTLKKKHNAVCYHKIREAVAAGIIIIHKIDSHKNTADLLTKCLSGVKRNSIWRIYCSVRSKVHQDSYFIFVLYCSLVTKSNFDRTCYHIATFLS